MRTFCFAFSRKLSNATMLWVAGSERCSMTTNDSLSNRLLSSPSVCAGRTVRLSFSSLRWYWFRAAFVNGNSPLKVPAKTVFCPANASTLLHRQPWNQLVLSETATPFFDLFRIILNIKFHPVDGNFPPAPVQKTANKRSFDASIKMFSLITQKLKKKVKWVIGTASARKTEKSFAIDSLFFGARFLAIDCKVTSTRTDHPFKFIRLLRELQRAANLTRG